MTSVDLIVCMPVYNDWESATLLIREIDGVVGGNGSECHGFNDQ